MTTVGWSDLNAKLVKQLVQQAIAEKVGGGRSTRYRLKQYSSDFHRYSTDSKSSDIRLITSRIRPIANRQMDPAIRQIGID